MLPVHYEVSFTKASNQKGKYDAMTVGLSVQYLWGKMLLLG